MSSETPDLPASMRALAEVFVSATAKLEPDFDYSPHSVEALDGGIEAWWPDRRPWRRGRASRGSARTMAPVIGAYVGEVIVRRLGGTWAPSEEGPGVDVGDFLAYPLEQAAKRFEIGPDESLWAFYRWIEDAVRGQDNRNGSGTY